ncbi:hypothetical protein E4U21_003032 [Claviceps maximensis]|nr:hypothetical protein E4U21_003032 [Claviceps maximensis]
MKFSTVLGSLAVCSLEAYASPIEVNTSNVASSGELEKRDGWCCVALLNSPSDRYFYIPRTTGFSTWTMDGVCHAKAYNFEAGSCAKWNFGLAQGCDIYGNGAYLAMQPADKCAH